MNQLTISQLAKTANVNIETVKYYERMELLPKPHRNGSGYRVYSDQSVEALHFIKNAKAIGFTLNEIRQLLALANNEPDFPVEEMRAFAEAKMREIEQQMNRLEQFKSLLARAAALPGQPSEGSRHTCPVLAQIRKR